MTAPREIRNTEPTIFGALTALAWLAIVWFACQIDQLGRRLTRAKEGRDA